MKNTHTATINAMTTNGYMIKLVGNSVEIGTIIQSLQMLGFEYQLRAQAIRNLQSVLDQLQREPMLVSALRRRP